MSLLVTATADLILQINNNMYEENNIFSGLSNNYTLPNTNDYVIITEGTSDYQNKPNRSYDGDLQIETYDLLRNTNIQVDFYGINANLVAGMFQNYLLSLKSTDFLFQKYGFSVYKVKEILNLTMVLDTEEYIPRFTVNFSLFNNNKLQLNVPRITGIVTDLIYVEEIANVN